MSDVSGFIERGTSRTEGDTHTLHWVLRLPYPVAEVWRAVATPEGLSGWLAAADVFEPRLGGAVSLRWLNDETPDDAVHSGHVTAWDPHVVAEYTIDLHGRCRFHLEPAGDAAATLRFTNELTGDDAFRLDCLAGWHDHFGFLVDALGGRPKDWSTWSLDRWRELRADYASDRP
ncbi:SRPBCC domain-containing protein [Streptomyces sp. MNP-20]|uniref:SRPBCC domain-containing protein n=1 Tax=Streptomyces sp. MNP-20 TaxID=2721165 RepID=UPI001552D9C5|nr:SRPBCC domain-containing protein [Streptomyces sp. MNP-20]